MASAKQGISIASKLFQSLEKYEYREYCQSIIEHDAVHMCDFHKLSISGTHFIDVRQCFIDNIFNPSHVLDYFTRFSGLNCFELRKQVIDILKSDREYWVHVASIVLLLRPKVLMSGWKSWKIQEAHVMRCLFTYLAKYTSDTL